MRTYVPVVVFAVLLSGLGAVRAQSQASTASTLPERFTAFAVNTSNVGPAGASTVEIVTERWTTDAERDRFRDALMENGPDGLLREFQRARRVGFIRTPDSIGYDLKYARQMPTAEGGRRITIATDRRIGFWEAANRPRTIDYPFTVIELRLNKDGEGEGRMSLLTKITLENDNTLVLENYANQPVLLTTVHKQQ